MNNQFPLSFDKLCLCYITFRSFGVTLCLGASTNIPGCLTGTYVSVNVFNLFYLFILCLLSTKEPVLYYFMRYYYY